MYNVCVTVLTYTTFGEKDMSW